MALLLAFCWTLGALLALGAALLDKPLHTLLDEVPPPLHPPCISAASPLHLPCISPALAARRGELGVGLG